MAAEKECRSCREVMEHLSETNKQDKAHIKELEDALSAEEARHQETRLASQEEIKRLEELVESVRKEAFAEMSGLDRSRGQVFDAGRRGGVGFLPLWIFFLFFVFNSTNQNMDV